MIEVKHLTKMYGDFAAVSDLSFTIEPGHIYGFLGPNGAGKSTTMNIMTGCLAQTSGEVLIDGHDVYEEPKAAKRLIGYLPELPPLYLDETPLEYLMFVAEAKGIPAKERVDAVLQVIAETHIENVQEKMIKHLSKGYKQRVGVAQALLGNPEMIILDEPTVGLDPMQIIEIRDLIRELGENHTVILSSHILSEIQAVCDQVIIINHGKLIVNDTLENITQNMVGTASIELTVDGTFDQVQAALSGVEDIQGIEVVQEEGTNLSLVISLTGSEADAKSKEVALALAQKMIPVYKLNPVKASLENIFIELAGKDPAEFEETSEEIAEETEEAPISDEELERLAMEAAPVDEEEQK